MPKNLPNSGRPAGKPVSSSIQSTGKERESDGVVLAHRYKMEHKLGSGAFGCAYLVVDLKANNERYGSILLVYMNNIDVCIFIGLIYRKRAIEMFVFEKCLGGNSGCEVHTL